VFFIVLYCFSIEGDSGRLFFILAEKQQGTICLLVNPQRLFVGIEKNDKKQNHEMVDIRTNQAAAQD
jgi:hypothetical protein